MAPVQTRAAPEDDGALVEASALYEAGAFAQTIQSCRAALVRDPRRPAVRLLLAAALLAREQIDESLAEADAVLHANPACAAAQFIRGTALHNLGNFADAAVALQSAVRLTPLDGAAWLNLGVTLTALDRLDAACWALRRACTVSPQSAAAAASLGTALVRALQLPEAIVAFDRALELRPDFAAARWDRGFARLLGGDYPAGWADWRVRKPEETAVLASLGAAGAEWAGGSCDGMTLLAYSTQGLGDAIQFARFLPMLARCGARVTLVCDAALTRLLAPSVAAVATPGHRLPPHDAWVALSSLPRLFATDLGDMPSPRGYLTADPQLVRRWRDRLGGGFKVGLVWAGNPAHGNDARRSMPLPCLKTLPEVPGMRFASLQRGGIGLPANIVDLAPWLTDLAETAAAMTALDLIITVDTAAAHLAGALGRPAWVALPHAPDWRWLLGRDDSPWYDSVRLFRQPRPGDWQSVAESLADALRGAA